jgi:DNA polymerase III epsilon subunit-like protein
MTDLETSGDIPGVHEILEIGLVLFEQSSGNILDKWEIKIRPEHIENAVPAAIERNGYDPKKWENAISLPEAIQIYGEKTQNAIFCSYNVSFDWPFINDAFYSTKIPNPMSTKENHDRLDVLTLAWAGGLKKGESLSLKSACKLFKIPEEPEPHSALNGALTAYLLWKKLTIENRASIC